MKKNIQKISDYMHFLLYCISLCISGFYLFNTANFKRPFGDLAFIVLFVTLIILCNLQYVTGIIKSIVRDKIEEYTDEKFKDEMRKGIKDFFKEEGESLIVETTKQYVKKQENIKTPADGVNK